MARRRRVSSVATVNKGMSRVAGSADGLGRMAAQALVEEGQAVALHGRNAHRKEVAYAAVSQAQAVESNPEAALERFLITPEGSI